MFDDITLCAEDGVMSGAAINNKPIG